MAIAWRKKRRKKSRREEKFNMIETIKKKLNHSEMVQLQRDK